jgi:hypothetical protein
MEKKRQVAVWLVLQTLMAKKKSKILDKWKINKKLNFEFAALNDFKLHTNYKKSIQVQS